jgi:hypothetical protein
VDDYVIGILTPLLIFNFSEEAKEKGKKENDI